MSLKVVRIIIFLKRQVYMKLLVTPRAPRPRTNWQSLKGEEIHGSRNRNFKTLNAKCENTVSDIELWTAIIIKKTQMFFLYSFSSLILLIFLHNTVIFLTYWKFLCLTNPFFNWQ